MAFMDLEDILGVLEAQGHQLPLVFIFHIFLSNILLIDISFISMWLQLLVSELQPLTPPASSPCNATTAETTGSPPIRRNGTASASSKTIFKNSKSTSPESGMSFIFGGFLEWCVCYLYEFYMYAMLCHMSTCELFVSGILMHSRVRSSVEMRYVCMSLGMLVHVSTTWKCACALFAS